MAQFSKLFVFNFVKILQEKINYITNFYIFRISWQYCSWLQCFNRFSLFKQRLMISKEGLFFPSFVAFCLTWSLSNWIWSSSLLLKPALHKISLETKRKDQSEKLSSIWICTLKTLFVLDSSQLFLSCWNPTQSKMM